MSIISLFMELMTHSCPVILFHLHLQDCKWNRINIFYYYHCFETYKFIIVVDNEERAIIEPRSLEDPRVKELIQVLIDWINDELATQRIIVQDISEDLYDGQVLQKLLEILTKTKLDVPEVTQSEEGQRQKLAVVLRAVNRVCRM